MRAVERRRGTSGSAAAATKVHAARRPGRPAAADSVDDAAFLDAALRAFALNGYDGVSVRTLSKELGVSHGWVHQRYGSKQGLWYAAIDRGFGRQAEAIAFDPTIDDPLEQFESGIRQFLVYSAGHRELGLIMNTEGRQDTERLDYIFERYVMPAVEPLERLLDHLVAAGRVRPVPLRTWFLLVAHGAAAPFGLVPLAERLEGDDPLTGDRVSEHIDAVTRLILDGLRTDA